MNPFRRPLTLAVSALVFLTLFVPRTLGQGSREADLEAIRSQIGRLEQRLGSIQASAEDLTGQLRRTEVELELQEQRVLEAQAAQALAAERVEESSRRAAELEEQLVVARKGLRSRLQGLYRIGELGYLRMLLSVAPNADSLEAVRLLRYLARRDAAAIERFQEVQANLEAQRERLLEQEALMQRWAQQEGDRRQELAGTRRRQARVLARLEKERQVLADEAGFLREKERKLTELLSRLAETQDAETAEAGLDATPIQDFRGVLDWPVQGTVKQGFGTVKDPRYGTKLPHKGLDLSLDGRQEVKAIYPGNVLFAGPFEGYGSMVVLLHAGRVFSIYTGLEELQVAQKDVVSLNQVVGSAVDLLYFEMRVEKHPEDPLEWLR